MNNLENIFRRIGLGIEMILLGGEKGDKEL